MLHKLGIKALILTTVGILVTLIAFIGALGIYSMSNSVTLLKDVSLQSLNRQATIEKIRSRMETNRSQILQALQHNPATDYSKMHDHSTDIHAGAIEKNTVELKNLWSEYQADKKSNEEKALADDWYKKSGSLGLESIALAVSSIQSEKWDDAQNTLIQVINPTYRTGDAAFDVLSKSLVKDSHLNDATVDATIKQTRNITIAAIVFAIVLTTVIGIFLARAVTGPLTEAVGIARSVADGDLTRRIVVRSKNEFGILLTALSDMSSSLAHIVANVRSGTDTIATASGQIAAGNQDLSSRTEQQAGSLEETASSMEELTATVKQNADNARQANNLAVSASDIAVSGRNVVSEVIDTMGAINDSAKKIVDIIGVIDGIAFQTNILALNAAVEAARAGEQGRGFAVVASEVRNLAQRSAAAAKEIKALISDSVEKVDAGAMLVDQAGETMSAIVDSVKRVTDIMSEISAASLEQTAGIEQINHAISQMDQATQQNAALVEQAASASEAMQGQAGKLAQVVSVFKIDPSYISAELTEVSPHSRMVFPPAKEKPLNIDVRKAAKRTPRLVDAHNDGGEWEQF